MHRFFVNPLQIQKPYVDLDREILDHIKVLRLLPNEEFIVCDGEKTDYICTLESNLGRIISQRENKAEPRLALHLFLAYTRGERLDFALQKAVELGTSSITFFPATRCVAKYEEKSLGKKLPRWEKISKEAAQQSGRGIIPPVYTAASFSAGLKAASAFDLGLFCYENELKQGLGQVLRAHEGASSIGIVIGPEGGFTPEEATLGSQLGLHSVSLGPRILRAETAPIAALSALLYHGGEL